VQDLFTTAPEVVSMEKNSRLSKVLLCQNLGFLVILILSYLDELLKLPDLIFSEHPFAFLFHRTTLEALLIFAVWLLVSASTRRTLERLRYLENFMRVCAWCHDIDYFGRWMPLQEFLRQGLNTPNTTHGICPKCLAKEEATLEQISQAKPKTV